MDYALKIGNKHGKDVLMSLTYISRNNEQNSCIELARILEQALRNNEKNDITSALIMSEKYFIQTVEGSRLNLNQLVLGLINDNRHFSIELVSTQKIKQRRWEGVLMKYLTPNIKSEGCIAKHFSTRANFNPYLMDKNKITEFIDAMFDNTRGKRK